MKIDAFKLMLQTGGSGRVVQSNSGESFQGITNRLGGRLTAVRDAFARVFGGASHIQKAENLNTRISLHLALKEAYGDRLPAGMLDKILSQPQKPLSVSEVRKIVVTAEANAAPLRIVMPNTGQAIDVKRSDLPPEVLATTRNVGQALQEKVDAGHRLMNDIVAGTRDIRPPATKTEVNNLAWFLHLASEQKAGAPYSSGTLTTVDRDQKLRDFFDSCPDSYRRISSHVEGFARNPGGGHRGIDFPKGDTLDTILPHGRETILYGAMTHSEATPLAQPMMFMKLESHGCRLCFLTSAHRSPDVADRPLQKHDLRHFVGHTLSFLHSASDRRTGNHGGETRKERIPAEVKTLYQQLIDSAPLTLQETLLRNDPFGTAGGVRIMLENIGKVRERQLEALPDRDMFEVEVDGEGQKPVPEQDLFAKGFDVTGGTVLEGYLMDKYPVDTLHLRIGNEVILKRSDLE